MDGWLTLAGVLHRLFGWVGAWRGALLVSALLLYAVLQPSGWMAWVQWVIAALAGSLPVWLLGLLLLQFTHSAALWLLRMLLRTPSQASTAHQALAFALSVLMLLPVAVLMGLGGEGMGWYRGV